MNGNASRIRQVATSATKTKDTKATRNQFNPHSADVAPWFEGWYTRVQGVDESVAFGLGHFPDQYTEEPGVACFILIQPRDKESPLQSFAHYFGNVRIATTHFAGSSHPDRLAAFTVSADDGPSDFQYAVDGRNISFTAKLGTLELKVDTTSTSEITRWSDASAVPEGWATKAGPLLGLQWFVYSTDTSVRYYYKHRPAGQPGFTSEGVGRAHMEKNWGTSFPGKWLWAQGYSWGDGSELDLPQPQASFVLAGGILPLKPLPDALGPRIFALSYRKDDFSFACDAWKPAIPVYKVDACGGRLDVWLYCVDLTHVVHVELSAPPHTFSHVTCPTQQGFQETSVQSFCTSAKVTVMRRRGLWGQEVLSCAEFAGAALEYGGDFKCPDQEYSPVVRPAVMMEKELVA